MARKRRRVLIILVALVAVSAGALAYQMIADRINERRRRADWARSTAYLARMEKSPDAVIRALASIGRIHVQKMHRDDFAADLPTDYQPIERRTIGGRVLEVAYHDGWRLRGYFFAVFTDEDGRKVPVPIGETEDQKKAALEAVELLWLNKETR